MAIVIGAAACGSGATPGVTVTSTAPVVAPPVSPGPATGSPNGHSLPAWPQSASAAQTLRPTASTPPADPEQGRDPVGVPIVLTGTVRVQAECTVLDADGRRWALVGASAAGLTAGRRVTLRGRPARIPDGCAADAALRVTR